MKVAIACGVLVALLALSACSPYLYKDEVMNVSSAVGSISSGWKNGQQAMADDYQAIVVERASWDGLPAVINGSCVVEPDMLKPVHESDKLVLAFIGEITNNHLNRGGMSCKVDLIQNDLMRPGPIAAEKTMKEIDETISVLSAYTAALLALTNASDKDALTKAATSVNAAVAQAADVAKTLGAKDEDVALAKASSSVVMDMIGLVADTERYRVLKRYVLAVDPLMPTLSGEIGDALELIRGKRLPILAQRVTLEAVEYNAGSASRASTANGVLLATLLTQAASYNDLSSAKTADLVTKLAKTHHALADALRQDKGQMTTLFDAAKTLANDADQLEKAISSQAATGKPSK